MVGQFANIKICSKCVKKTNIKTPEILGSFDYVKLCLRSKASYVFQSCPSNVALFSSKNYFLIILPMTARNSVGVIFLKISYQKLESSVKKALKICPQYSVFPTFFSWYSNNQLQIYTLCYSILLKAYHRKVEISQARSGF